MTVRSGQRSVLLDHTGVARKNLILHAVGVVAGNFDTQRNTALDRFRWQRHRVAGRRVDPCQSSTVGTERREIERQRPGCRHVEYGQRSITRSRPRYPATVIAPVQRGQRALDIGTQRPPVEIPRRRGRGTPPVSATLPSRVPRSRWRRRPSSLGRRRAKSDCSRKRARLRRRRYASYACCRSCWVVIPGSFS